MSILPRQQFLQHALLGTLRLCEWVYVVVHRYLLTLALLFEVPLAVVSV